MFRRFFLKFFLNHCYNNFVLEEARCRKILDLEEEHLTIFIIPNLFFIDYLIIRYALKHSNLDKSVVLFGYRKNIFEKIFGFFSAIFSLAKKRSNRRLTDYLKENKSFTLALGFNKRGLGEITPESLEFIEELVAFEKEHNKRIALVPVFITWGTKPKRGIFSFLDVLFGPNHDPGLFRKIYKMLRKSKKRAVNIGDSIKLSNILSQEKLPSKVICQAIQDSIKQEQFVVFGPKLISKETTINELLKEERLVSYIKSTAKSPKEVSKLYKRGRKILNEIASDLDFRMVEFFSFVLNWVWKHVYSGIIYSPEDLEKIRNYLKKGPVIFVPCHKSHIDYLIISYILHQNNIVVPQIVAGVNLSFWPMGTIFRHSGAYFIRRSFANDHFYGIIFESYVFYLMKKGFSQEIFIEGGRSRTGKLEFPKLGFISMVMKAYLKKEIKNLYFLPISISYEKIMEEKSYMKESTGKTKKKESFFDLLKLRKFLKNYGKVYINVGEPIDPSVYLDREIETEYEKFSRSFLFNLNNRIALAAIRGINREMTAVSGHLLSTLLLSETSDFKTKRIIRKDFEILKKLFLALKTNISQELFEEEALDRSLDRFLSEGKLEVVSSLDEEVYFMPDAKARINLNYYKNMIIHFLLPSSFICLILEDFQKGSKGAGKKFSKEALIIRFLSMAEKLSQDFVLNEEEQLKAEIDLHFKFLEENNILKFDWAENCFSFEVCEPEHFNLFKNIMLPTFETYNILSDYIRKVKSPEEKISEQEFEKKLLNHGKFLLRIGQHKYEEAINSIGLKKAIKYFEKLHLLKRSPEEGKNLIYIDEKVAQEKESLIFP